MAKRTLKEAEELIKTLQCKCWERDALIKKMRMSLYYVNTYMQEINNELDGMWFHHQDGSDLLVSKSELFDVIQNKIMGLISKGKKRVDEPLSELKKFIGW